MKQTISIASLGHSMTCSAGPVQADISAGVSPTGDGVCNINSNGPTGSRTARCSLFRPLQPLVSQ